MLAPHVVIDKRHEILDSKCWPDRSRHRHLAIPCRTIICIWSFSIRGENTTRQVYGTSSWIWIMVYHMNIMWSSRVSDPCVQTFFLRSRGPPFVCCTFWHNTKREEEEMREEKKRILNSQNRWMNENPNITKGPLEQTSGNKATDSDHKY